MQRPNPDKRHAILAAAARLFSVRPYHEVRLGDIAAAARIGKGTVYVYFDSKDDLYGALIYDGFSSLVDRLCDELSVDGIQPAQALRRIVEALVAFAKDHPDLFAITNPLGSTACRTKWQAKRQELADLIARIIRRGNRLGVMNDPHPDLTGLCVPGLIRSVYLFGATGQSPKRIVGRLLHLIGHGVGAKEPT